MDHDIPHLRLVINKEEETYPATQWPELSDFYIYGYQIIKNMPEKFAPYIQNIVLCVENFAHQEILDNLNLQDRNELLGLYRGIPLSHKTENHEIPDLIYLYRYPIIHYAEEQGTDIQEIIYHIMIHEIGHHFGFTDEEMHEIESSYNSLPMNPE